MADFPTFARRADTESRQRRNDAMHQYLDIARGLTGRIAAAVVVAVC